MAERERILKASAPASAGFITMTRGEGDPQVFRRSTVRATRPHRGCELIRMLLLYACFVQASRPQHKQEEPQTKGKGQVDWVWCKAEQPAATGTVAPYYSLEVERDVYSREAMRLAHTPCAETGEWPSDHALEGYTLTVTNALLGEREEDDA